MSTTPTAGAALEDHPIAGSPLPEFVDWILGAVIALGGMLSLVGGTALVFVVDREALAQSIEDGTVTVTAFAAELTEAEMVDVAASVVSWTGIGMLVTGLGMILFGVGYIIVRHRAHRRARDGDHVSSYWPFAFLGGIATVVLSFIPLSPVVGGALSGYLERGESTRTISVGALAGFLPVVPLLVLIVFVLGGVIAGMQAVGLGGMGIVVGATMIFSVTLVGVLGAGLGALGGYLGGWFAESQEIPG